MRYLEVFLYALTISFVAALGFGIYSSHTVPPPVDTHSVKIEIGIGHGSATHIGNGYFVTAHHVVGTLNAVSIKTSTGRKVMAEVLWSNQMYDVALLHADIDVISETNLDCRDPDVGEELKMIGNPLFLENITTKGAVAGLPSSLGPWRYAFPIDGSLGAGMSGGGVFDSDGDLVGIIVGGVMVRYGMGGGPLGIGVIVPSSVVCMLMAR